MNCELDDIDDSFGQHEINLQTSTMPLQVPLRGENLAFVGTFPGFEDVSCSRKLPATQKCPHLRCRTYESLNLSGFQWSPPQTNQHIYIYV